MTFIYISIGVCVYTCTIYVEEVRGQFSGIPCLSNMWVLGTEFRYLCMVANTLT